MKEKGSTIVRNDTTVKKPIIKAVPDPEVTEKAVRRKFTAEYKRRILKEADACTEQGQIGALLRREGLYSSNLTLWRRQVDEGLIPKKRNPLPVGRIRVSVVLPNWKEILPALPISSNRPSLSLKSKKKWQFFSRN